ncbi:hypothetical protein ORIO_22455 (plasmid) [Cereibacter azotoformans]|uniref:hypothetical protein n=1 Tax=Cereibacter azotoformans TaxID=43057 RepID=UPI001EEBD923|nr:hypothetical protein [Cereibacter azotoformans]ULB12537.1 hypothetical protein ORIO_22455 [Cereibacter azotoformans]
MRPKLFEYPYRVIRWSTTGAMIEEVAGAAHFSVALAAFEAALNAWRDEEMTLQQGARIMRKGLRPRDSIEAKVIQPSEDDGTN